MVRRRGNNNRANGGSESSRNIRGPVSALTSFLRESGITAARLTGWRRSIGDSAHDRANGNDGGGQRLPGRDLDENADAIVITQSSRERDGFQSEDNAEMPSDLDLPIQDTDGLVPEPMPNNQRVASSQASSSMSRRSKKTPINAEIPRECIRCGRDLPDRSSRILICPSCRAKRARKIEEDEDEKPLDFKKRRIRRRKAAIMSKTERSEPIEVCDGAVPSLQDLCITRILDNLDDLEMLPDAFLPSTLERISDIICKRRVLSYDLLEKLFIGRDVVSLRLMDCTKLGSLAFALIAKTCENLERLKLEMCGQIRDPILQLFAASFPRLKELTLGGCYLVTDAGFGHVVETLGDQLEVIGVRHGAMLTGKVIDQAVAKGAAVLRSLELEHCPNILEGVPNLAKCANLEHLSLQDSANGLTDSVIVPVLEALGPRLKSLNLSSQPEITDKVLDAISKRCTVSLRVLKLAQCPLLTAAEGLFKLITAPHAWDIELLDLTRNRSMSDEHSIASLLRHLGHSLRTLSFNGLSKLSTETLSLIPQTCPELRFLDISWCRMVDDVLLKEISESCKSLGRVKVFGCNKLTEKSARREWHNSLGIPVVVIGHEFN